MDVVIRTCMEIYIDVFFSCVYNIYEMTNRNWVDMYSNVVSIFWLAICLIFFCFITWVALYGKRNFEKPEKWQKMFSTLLSDVKKSSAALLEHVFYLVRRISLVLLVIFGQGNGILQLSLYLAVSILFIVYKVVVRPYKLTANMVHDIVSELILVAIVLLFFRYLKEDTKLVSKGEPEIIGRI